MLEIFHSGLDLIWVRETPGIILNMNWINKMNFSTIFLCSKIVSTITSVKAKFHVWRSFIWIYLKITIVLPPWLTQLPIKIHVFMASQSLAWNSTPSSFTLVWAIVFLWKRLTLRFVCLLNALKAQSVLILTLSVVSYQARVCRPNYINYNWNEMSSQDQSIKMDKTWDKA